MAAGRSQHKVQKLRTFAADYAAAKAGNGPAPTIKAVPTTPSTATASIKNPPSIKIPKQASEQLATEVANTLQPNKDSLLTTKDDVFDIKNAHSDVATGSIITDQKRRRTGVFSMIGTSLNSWLKRLSTIFTPAKTPEKTVAAPETRTDTIRSAASKSALAPSDDHQAITRHITNTPRTKTKPSVTIAQKEAVAAPSWSHLEGVVETSTPVSDTTSATEQARAALLSAVEADSNEPVTITPDINHVPLNSITDMSSAPVTKTIPAEETVPALPEEVPPEIPAAEPEPEPEPTIVSAPAPARTYAPSPKPAASYNLVMIGGVLLFAIVLGLGTTWLLFGNSEEATTITATVITTDLPVDQQLAVPITPSTDLLTDFIAAAQAQSTGIVQLYPAIAGAAGVEPANMTDTLTALNWRAPGNFTRAIERMTFGTIAGVEQFIIIKINSFDVALSGMIAWESTMSADLAPFFGTPVTTSFDPNARTIDQTRRAFFVDTLIANQDVRLLVDELGTERIIYSLIDRETILITTSREAFINLAPRL